MTKRLRHGLIAVGAVAALAAGGSALAQGAGTTTVKPAVETTSAPDRDNVQSGDENRTRLAVLGLEGAPVAARAQDEGPRKTTLVFAVRNVPGSLHRSLGAFATRGLNQAAVHVTKLGVGEGLTGTIAQNIETLNLAEAATHPEFQYKPETGCNNDLFIRGQKFDLSKGNVKNFKEGEWNEFEILVEGDKIVFKNNGEVQRTASDPQRAESGLGWRPEHDLERGIPITAEWFRNS